ncbi:hypothetical protein Nepgr_011193 [Nepenthes gracilis]|uniref:ABC-type xenobiotic transporter n=1 Tax=Nepenthes gracilis TaxID=150966 RepID=A0AAD3SDX3_NEPGR|nr:hypothetical protein Nepgr_011193 [Nepenthes gracilis]
MEKSLWVDFCENSGYRNRTAISFSSIFSAIIDPNSCINHAFIISADFLLLLSLSLVISIHKRSSRSIPLSAQRFPTSIWSLAGAIFNSMLGLGYLALGFWDFGENLRKEKRILPLHEWLVLLIHGVTWLLLGLIMSLKRPLILKPISILYSIFALIPCTFSLREVILNKSASAKSILDILLFPGAVLSLLYVFRWQPDAEARADSNGDASYAPLTGEDVYEGDNNVTPFSRAGFLSRMTFWWLNPLMKKGKEKVLENNDIPELRLEDRAKICYLEFMDQLSRQKDKGLSNPSILSIIFSWQSKPILISGVFALVKVLALSTGPLFLNAFIRVAEGKRAFKFEGYVLTALLFLTKCLESFSERQWYFRTRIIGLQVRSMLSAAIYQKQLRLSNAAKATHSPGEIVNYATVDAYRIGEFPFWLHQIWTAGLQMCLGLVIIYYCVGLATIAALVVIIVAVLGNSPLGRLQHEYQTKLMAEQDKRLRFITEALVMMKVLKLYAWEMHFKKVIERLREIEFKWLSAVILQKGYYIILFWWFPILMSIATFGACYLFGVALDASNVFTFLTTLRIVQEPVRLLPDVAGAYIQSSVSLDRIIRFFEASELQDRSALQMKNGRDVGRSIDINCAGISWDAYCLRPTLTNINLVVKPGEKVAICGEVGAGKSTLLAAILGEVPHINGTVQAYGKLAYASQTAWIQTGTIRENIVFGSTMDLQRYQYTLARCSLVKDLDMLPFGDQTVIGERGVNLSGGQKQRVQLARALYQDADTYLLDDPFSAVDAHTATSLFNEYVMGALSGKTVLLVTHQVDFLPAFDFVVLMSGGQILKTGTYDELMASSPGFISLVRAHDDTIHSEARAENAPPKSKGSIREMQKTNIDEQTEHSHGDQLIQREEREIGDTGLKPYIQYLRQGRGFLYLSLAILTHIVFLSGQSIQSYWLAANVENSSLGRLKLISIYSAIGCSLALLLLIRSFSIVALSLGASKSLFSTLLSCLFRAPMSFFDSTPLGRILSRISSDMSIIDLDVAVIISQAMVGTLTTYFSFGILAILTWEVLLVIGPMVYLTILLQRYYFATAKELMRINGTTKSTVASNLAESISGATTIRAFGKEEQFFSRAVDIIDKNASPFFHSFSANEWLIQRLEILCALVLSSSALALTLLPFTASASGFIGMALSYGLSLNIYLVGSVQSLCTLANMIVSAERIEQYTDIPSEADEIIEENRPPRNWPNVGTVEICDLKVRYRPRAPLVLQGISCTFEGGNKIGVVGRTGSGKTTLISTLFRLVEPSEGKIIIDSIDISTIGLHDLRSQLGIIPQDPALFSGSVRYNLDPLSEHTDQELWEVLEKCQLQYAAREKGGGLDSLVIHDGSNWSMGQRQLFCLGRALLKKRKILVLDEATASIDNTTDAILQKTIRTEFADCTVITVAHRIPTVMDCTMVLALSDGKVAEYDEPMKLIGRDNSLFGHLVREFWSRAGIASMHEDQL